MPRHTRSGSLFDKVKRKSQKISLVKATEKVKITTTNEALQRFYMALQINFTPEMRKFYHEMDDSDLTPEEKHFWCCLCNDLEDEKSHFYYNVEKFLLDKDCKINRGDWIKWNGQLKEGENNDD